MKPKRHYLYPGWRATYVLLGLVALGLAHQGCLATAWVAAVGADSTRTGDVIFRPFEGSWVSEKTTMAIVQGPSLTSIAMLPIDGDAEMGPRFAEIIEQQTVLQVRSCTKHQRESVQALDDETMRPVVARNVSQEMAVDAVFFGRVTWSSSHPSEWGWKHEETRRLFLYLVDHDGHLLWKDELPFTVVTGSKPPIEHAVTNALSYHFMDHVQAIGLDARGYMPKKSS